ncbi:hypothetical protein FDZ74_17905, partial [bacterium]
DDGGWGWWYDDKTDVYQTAWVVFGLAVTREAGYAVETRVIERGANYLLDEIKSNELMDPRIQAYALYSLARAGYGNRELTLALVEQVYALDAFSQAGLALALQKLGEKDQAKTVLDILNETLRTNGTASFWAADRVDGKYHNMTMSSSIRSTALGLTAFLQIEPDSENIPQLVSYLMKQRKAYGWGTTNETAFTLLALTDFVRQTQQNENAINYQVLINDQPITSGMVTRGEPAVAILLPLDEMQTGPNLFKIVTSGEGMLYFDLISRISQDLPSIDPAGTIEVSRTYTDPKTKEPVTHLQVGQLVRVSVRIKGPANAIYYVLVEDHLPAGLE